MSGEHLQNGTEVGHVRKRLPDKNVDIGGESSPVVELDVLRRVQVEKVAEVVVHVDCCNNICESLQVKYILLVIRINIENYKI